MSIDWKNPHYAPEIARRCELYKFLYEQDHPRQFTKTIFKDDPVSWINSFLWTVDPRLENEKIIPFLLFDRQIEYINWVRDCSKNKKNGICLKSRDMGISWVNCALAVWYWLFQDASNVVFASYKRDVVDILGDMSTIMEKCRFIVSMLPNHFLPKGFNAEKHCGYMKIINPQTRASITGQIGQQIGRGGRSTIGFLDECEFVEHPLEADGALSQNSNVIIYVTTVRAMDGYFYKKFKSNKIPSFKFHWTDDPRKDQIWYDKQKSDLHPIILAREIDMDPSTSSENICIQYKWVMAAVNLELEEQDVPLQAGLDVADEGGDSNALCIIKGNKIIHIEEWKEGDTAHTTRKAYSICSNYGVDTLFYDSIGVGAGVKSEMRLVNESFLESDNKDRSYKINSIGVSAAQSPTRGWYKEGKRNKDMFQNIKAELWWKLADRFRKTYQHVNGEKEYPHSELISIPRNDKLIEELSSQKVDYGSLGKIKMVDKKSMKQIGISSPNLADSMILSTYSTPSLGIVTF